MKLWKTKNGNTQSKYLGSWLRRIKKIIRGGNVLHSSVPPKIISVNVHEAYRLFLDLVFLFWT